MRTKATENYKTIFCKYFLDFYAGLCTLQNNAYYFANPYFYIIKYQLHYSNEKTPTVERLLKNMGNMHELGRQRAFELGNPFYGQFEEYGKCWCKELPTGEKYLVEIEIIRDANGIPKEIKDTVIKKLN